MAAPAMDDEVRRLVATAHPHASDRAADAVQLSAALFPSAEYTLAEQSEIERWTAAAAAAPTAERLSQLNAHLAHRTTVLGSKPSVADVAVFCRLAPVVRLWPAEQRTGAHGYHHIVRHLDFVQNAPLFGLAPDAAARVDIDPAHVVAPITPVDARAEKERKRREKAAVSGPARDDTQATATGPARDGPQTAQGAPAPAEQNQGAAAAADTKDKPKREKQPRPPKPPKPPAVPDKPFSPALIDLRVGHILKAERHPNADSLYVSTIACGDAPGTDNTSEYQGQIVRTVCSGLNGLVPLEEMQNRKIVAVCNLKPVTMRGIKSAAMVLAASPRVAPGEDDHHAGPVELVNPPADAEAGERVYFEGFEGEPDPVLNPKKKVWEDNQVGFTTTDDKIVAFDPAQVEKLKDCGTTGPATLRTRQGPCTVNTLRGATVR